MALRLMHQASHRPAKMDFGIMPDALVPSTTRHVVVHGNAGDGVGFFRCLGKRSVIR